MNDTINERPTRAFIDLDALASNFHSSKVFIGGDMKYMAVVKADAYGHGSVQCARRLDAEGVDWFGVALVEEGVELRKAGMSAPILCLGGYWHGQEGSLLEFEITPVIFEIGQARTLHEYAKGRGIKVAIHVKIDTGMGRLGVRSDDAGDFANALTSFDNLHVEGLMTHFAVADNLSQNKFTDEQIQRFHNAVDEFRSFGFAPHLIHLANSPGAVGHPGSRCNLVRLGGILYGLGGDVLPPGITKPELLPVMSLFSELSHLKKVPKGETVGYGRTFTTERDSLIAAVPIGYHDGYRRVLSNEARVIVNGAYAPVVGRISMDWTMIDVTEIPRAAIGDKVVLIGNQGDACVKAEDLAKLANTISYEITCGISGRVRRFFEGSTT
jgi:alanine racemase